MGLVVEVRPQCPLDGQKHEGVKLYRAEFVLSLIRPFVLVGKLV